jgi:hypothetical protein
MNIGIKIAAAQMKRGTGICRPSLLRQVGDSESYAYLLLRLNRLLLPRSCERAGGDLAPGTARGHFVRIVTDSRAAPTGEMKHRNMKATVSQHFALTHDC